MLYAFLKSINSHSLHSNAQITCLDASTTSALQSANYVYYLYTTKQNLLYIQRSSDKDIKQKWWKYETKNKSRTANASVALRFQPFVTFTNFCGYLKTVVLIWNWIKMKTTVSFKQLEHGLSMVCIRVIIIGN